MMTKKEKDAILRWSKGIDAERGIDLRQAKLEMDMAKMNRAVAALKAWRKGKEGQ